MEYFPTNNNNNSNNNNKNKTLMRKEKKNLKNDSTIDNSTMWELIQFYYMEDAIDKCRESKIIEFERHCPSIGYWWGDDLQLSVAPRLSSTAYQSALHNVLWIAQDYLNLFGFVGFYMEKDMGKWNENKNGKSPLLPFGVIEYEENKELFPGHYSLVRKSTKFGGELEFVCTDESKKRNYNFFVFSRRPKFKLTRRQSDNSQQPFTVGFSSTVDTIGLIPISRFTTLHEQWKRVIEARISVDDAQAMSCRPESFIVAKPLEKVGIDELSERAMYGDGGGDYGMDDIDSGKQEMALNRIQTGLNMVSGQRDRLRNNATAGYGRGREREMTVYQQRSLLFGRPTMCESLEYLPSSVEINRGPAPRSLIDPEHLEQLYHENVCNVMCYPYIFFKAHSSTVHTSDASSSSGGSKGGGMNNTTQLQNAQKTLDSAVLNQEKIFQEIYRELYMRTYAYLDVAALQNSPPEVQPLLEGLCVKLEYDNKLSKSDLAVQNILDFYEWNLVSRDEVRKILSRNYGLEEEEEKEGNEEFGLNGEIIEKREKKKKGKKKKKKAEKESTKRKRKEEEEEVVVEEEDEKKKKEEKGERKEKKIKKSEEK